MFQQVKVYLVYVWLKNSFHRKAVLFWGVVIMIGGLHFAYCVVLQVFLIVSADFLQN